MIARVATDFKKEALTRTGARQVDFSKKSMLEFIFIEPIGVDMDSDLEYWIDKCLEYNAKENRSKAKLNSK